MKLLVITQKVDINDDNLGFFHHWIEKLAAEFEKVYVICLCEGERKLPPNVDVCSMGKEAGVSKIGQFFELQKCLLKSLGHVDGVFVHMSPIYLIASFPLIKIFRKKAILWYTHKSRNWKLRLAEKLTHKVLTASKESFRIKSKKVVITGHGIDTQIFVPTEGKGAEGGAVDFLILTAGRIVPSKNLETQILAMDILVNKQDIKNIKLVIAGSEFEYLYPGYRDTITKLISDRGLEENVVFVGPVLPQKMPRYYREAMIFVNSSKTGSVDKTVLEAMACGVPTISSNEAFGSVLPLIDKHLYFKEGDSESLAHHIRYIMSLDRDKRSLMGMRLREVVVRNHNLDRLIQNIRYQFLA